MEKVDLLLINPPFHQRNGSGSIFPLGLGYIISSIENHGYSWGVIDCAKRISSCHEDDLEALERFLDEEMGRYSPELIGIGPCITTQVKALKMIADCCMRHFSRERVFAGGPLASIDGQEWLFFDYLGLDYIIKGDGETAVLSGMHHVKGGKRLSDCMEVTTRERRHFNEIADIDKIAFPHRPNLKENVISVRRDLGDQGAVTASMITSRGCPYRCHYCVSGNMRYRRFRKRSNEDIVSELAYLQGTGVSDVVFYDDCFFYNAQRVNEEVEKFCTLLMDRGIGLTWQMEIRADVLSQLSERSVLLLSKSGCGQVNVGVEKTDSESLRHLGKDIKSSDAAEGIGRIKGLSPIRVAGTFILGGGRETEGDVMRMIERSQHMGLDLAHFNPLFVYPGTQIYEDVFRNEREWVDYVLRDELPWGEIVYENEHMGRGRLLELVDYAYACFYEGTDQEGSAMVRDRFNLRRKGR